LAFTRFFVLQLHWSIYERNFAGGSMDATAQHTSP